MHNLYSSLHDNPTKRRKLNVGESMFTIYNCRLKNKYEDLWSHLNYIIYVAEGRKTWHTPHGSYDLREGSCVFVRKGAAIVEQFFDTEFCFFLFFVTDEFICDVLKDKSRPVQKTDKDFGPVIRLDTTASLEAFFHSMSVYIDSYQEPDQSLLELKFRELILTIADDDRNSELSSFFSRLLHEPQLVSLARIMEDNFCYNLKLEDFAKLCSRSLSAFKRDFQKHFHTTPGKWLLEKRLNYSMHLLHDEGRTVTEAAFESGFESPSHFSRRFRQYFGIVPASIKARAA